MNSDSRNQDCEHRSCRFITRAFALGRPVPRRCRRFCPAAASIVGLDELGRGQSGRILRVGGRPAARRRLLELGVVRGETIILQRAAPLGDPLEFVIKDISTIANNPQNLTRWAETVTGVIDTYYG